MSYLTGKDQTFSHPRVHPDDNIIPLRLKARAVIPVI
jgi:hypothetical protein